jgi:hypothetical protein
MARIRARRDAERTHLTITGRLTAADMGRLEHACGLALTRHSVALTIDLRRVTALDRTADALLRRLGERGARITLPSAGAIPFTPKCDHSKTPRAIG